MILEYEKKQTIHLEKVCEHVVNGVIVFDDLIRTDYIPTNFSATPKNFLLRDKHDDWDKLHADFENKTLFHQSFSRPTRFASFRTAPN